MALRPLDALKKNIGNRVIVELRGNREYRGILDGYDPHMNLVLKNAQEIVDEEEPINISLVIVRGDNVIYISP